MFQPHAIFQPIPLHPIDFRRHAPLTGVGGRLRVGARPPSIVTVCTRPIEHRDCTHKDRRPPTEHRDFAPMCSHPVRPPRSARPAWLVKGAVRLGVDGRNPLVHATPSTRQARGGRMRTLPTHRCPLHAAHTPCERGRSPPRRPHAGRRPHAARRPHAVRSGLRRDESKSASHSGRACWKVCPPLRQRCHGAPPSYFRGSPSAVPPGARVT